MPEFGAIIAGTGSYLPEKRLTNEDLSKLVETNDEWIVQRTGIRERRIAGPGESTATLATAAAKRALADAGMQARELDLIICGTISPEMTFPSTACFVAAALGLNSTPAFDIAAACSGFIYTLETGTAFIKVKKEWPSWMPPADMIERWPHLKPVVDMGGLPGGPENPLGARALYLFDEHGKDTLYRIHGTNEPEKIGQGVSSGCIRMRNIDAIDLFNRVSVGTTVLIK